jgi:hypothetical protein
VHVVEIEIVLVIFAQDIIVLLRGLLVLLAVYGFRAFLLGLLRLQVSIPEFLLADKRAFPDLEAPLLEVVGQLLGIQGAVEVHAQLEQDLVEVVVLLLHLLVVAAALLGLPTLHEVGHALEYLVRPAQVLEDEVPVVDLQEEVIQFVLFVSPVSLLDVLALLLHDLVLGGGASLGRFLPVLLLAQLDVALLAEQGLEVVARNHLFFLLSGGVGVAGRHLAVGQRSGLVAHGLSRGNAWMGSAFRRSVRLGGFGSLLRLVFAGHEFQRYLECL